MAGISDQALQFGKWNRYRYNGIELDTSLGLDDYEAKLRDLDPQVGRWWQVDPKSENSEFLSPYASNNNDPILLKDPDGDVPGGCCDLLDRLARVLSKDVAAIAGFANGAMHTATGGAYHQPNNPDDIYNNEDAEAYKEGYAFGSVAPLPMPGTGESVPNSPTPAMATDGSPAPSASTMPSATVPSPTVATPSTQDRVSADGGGEKTYQTYQKPAPEGSGKEPYVGRTSGTGTPEENVANRDRNHHMTEQGYGPAKLDATSVNSDAIRGREQLLIIANGGAQSSGGTSSNAINGISPTNPKRIQYFDAAKALTTF